jgi:hypothetical protein
MAEQIKPLQEQVQLDATAGRAGYTEAFDNAALTPDLFGQLGASMALNASMELNKRRGIESGMNPSGDVLPPLTSADKAYVDAYQNQAQATLTNQAQVVFDKAQEEMSKLDRMNPEAIAQYQKNLHESLSDILKLAPTDVRVNLANQFSQQLEASRHRYTQQWQSQQKQEAISKSNVALAQITSQIHDAAMDGNSELAESLSKNSEEMIKRGMASGYYSPSKSESLRKANRLNLLSSTEIKKGMDAKRAGKLDTYLMDLADEKKKPANISWSDWESIRGNSFKYLNNIRSLESQHFQLVASDGYVDIANGSMTAEKLEQLKSDLREAPLLYNNLAIAFTNQQRSSAKNQLDENFVAQNWSNTEALVSATPSKLNEAFRSLSSMKMQTAQQQGKPISQDEAEYQVAASAGVPIPEYNKKISNNLKSSNPDLMVKGIQTFHKLNALDGNKTSGVLGDAKAMAKMSAFEHFLELGNDTQTAAAMAENNVTQKTPEELSIINSQTKQLIDKHGPTPSALDSWVNSIANVPKDAHITNQRALTATVVGQYKDAMKWANGNEEIALSMIDRGFKKAWGVSEINGRKEMTYLPIEQAVRLDSGAVPLMQLEIAQQVKMQVADTKRAYDQGHSEFYYEVKEPPEFDKYLKAKSLLKEKGLSDPTYAVDKQLVKQFEAGAPVEVARVYRNKNKEEFTVNVMSNPYQGVDPQSGTVKGDYDIGLVRKDNGLPEHFIGIYGSTHSTPVYRPDTQFLQSRYLAVNGINPTDLTREGIQKRIEEFSQKMRDEAKSRVTLHSPFMMGAM